MTPLRCASTNAPSTTAKSFLRLANRSFFSTVSTAGQSCAVAPLEFLVPRCASQARGLLGRNDHLKLPAASLRESLFTINLGPRRNFTASAARRATVCVLNPLKDEDGKEAMLEITPRAATRLSQIMTKDGNPNLALRIQVESGGCHGFQYLMSLVTIPAKDSPGWSEVVREDDTIFQFMPDEADAQSPPPENAPRIILDEPSLDLLKGSKVDFTMELIGSQFKIVDNPYATSSCGCGTSFDVKM
ncbi:Iron-sulfur cluster insertion protein ErpA-like protein [Hapsidospora chrysogenum ATCC 11550]|uniref:Iron-sulfur cluster insertion protein ErpA-like protein n=1 Tax=Hapsidospora chrysogenum (strain ATCC 11550 / CBS 779.69 / DSM 880 / IAM 14645 / JCM 23072 / IMI 49137) TaxID=857340 RepID=A0A086SX08_HAPC1|nr:Iron-sulfur cluster insertion protein ErpA-like protein [Hapsidospora chrysogenum ATCC 11550]